MLFYILSTNLKRFVVITLMTFACLLTMQLLQLGFAIEGTASWYGPNYAGKPTANGEIYNPRELTAAHQHLAFNTVVRVTNLLNGKSIDVRINDRGPFIDNRIIDLSEAAAERINMKYTGLAKVRLSIIKTGDVPPVITPVNTLNYPTNYIATHPVITNQLNTAITTIQPVPFTTNHISNVSTYNMQVNQVNQPIQSFPIANNSSNSPMTMGAYMVLADLANTTLSPFLSQPTNLISNNVYAPTQAVVTTNYVSSTSLNNRPYRPTQQLPYVLTSNYGN